MTPEMKLDGNHKMDWFFTGYVGTQLPSYQRNATLDTGEDGDVGMSFEDDAVERERQCPDAGTHRPGTAQWQVFLGRAHLTGNSTFDEKIPRKGLKDKPERAAINYYGDVLASPNQIAADREPRMNRGSLACSPVTV
jgi:hypothetical protein